MFNGKVQIQKPDLQKTHERMLLKGNAPVPAKAMREILNITTQDIDNSGLFERKNGYVWAK